MTVTEAGHLGGTKVREEHGREFYRRIGQAGQQAMRRKHPHMAATWGRLGGRPRKPNLNDMGSRQE